MLGGDAEQLKLVRFHSFKSAASPRSVPLLFPMLILAGAIGCAARPVTPIDPSGPIELAPNEALLILHIDTDIALRSLTLSNRSVAHSLGKGRHVWMVRVPEGDYRWKSIEIRGRQRGSAQILLESDEELSFVVEAGKINYPGELAIRSSALSRWGAGEVIVRNRNHSAMAVRELKGSYDALLSAFPLHYAGLSGDGFLEYYSKKRGGPAAESSGATHREGRVDSQSEAP